jgi:nitroimidazol reductase NimA-like FMN-containing flavoprotein (pyridoxamine 5'-phosphate oxidase superfamily)
MQLIDLNTGLEVIEWADCVELLVTEDVGRLAVVVGGRPEIFPVNYVVDGEAIVFRTDGGTKLSGATQGPVAFEVDHFDPVRRAAWSVVVHGRAHQVTSLDNPLLRQRIARLALYPWTGHEKPHVLRIVPQTVTGRRVHPVPRSPDRR